MKKVLATTGVIALMAMILTGCTSQSNPTFVPPGASLGKTVVDPPAALPARMAIVPENPKTFDYSICSAINEVEPQAISFINNPPSSIPLKTASVKGETVVKASQMQVDSIFPSKFNHLVKAELNTGSIVWFGANGDLNQSKVSVGINLNSSRNEAIFGATEDAYDHFIWGDSLTASSPLRIEGTAVVKKYGTCFEPRNGQVPTETTYLTPTNAANLLSRVFAFRQVEPRLASVVKQEFRWNNIVLVDNGRYGSQLVSQTANGSTYCLTDYTAKGSMQEIDTKAGELSMSDFVFYATTDCSGTGIDAITATTSAGKTGVNSQNIEAKPYVDAFQDYYSSL